MNQNNPLELFLNDEVQRLLDHFAGLLELRFTLYSQFGLPIRRGRSMPNTGFCSFVQNDLNLLDRCHALDSAMRDEVTKTRSALSYCCHAGLGEIIAPILIDDYLAGFLMVGQFRTTEQVPKCILEQCHTPEQRRVLNKKYKELPLFTPERRDDIIGVFQMLIDYIAARELATVKNDDFKQAIDRYIEEHYQEDLKLPALAASLGKSVSSIAQYLRNKYHTCFKNLLIERRLNAAEEYWKKHPEASIRECAEAAGFKDQFYFSRIFHQKRAMSPRKFRAKWNSIADK